MFFTRDIGVEFIIVIKLAGQLASRSASPSTARCRAAATWSHDLFILSIIFCAFPLFSCYCEVIIVMVITVKKRSQLTEVPKARVLAELVRQLNIAVSETEETLMNIS